MTAKAKKTLRDYFKAVGVSEMPRKEKKDFKIRVTKAMKALDTPFVWDTMLVLYPMLGGTKERQAVPMHFKDVEDTDGTFRLIGK